MNYFFETIQLQKMVAIDKGLKHWQINLQLDQNDTSLIDYFKIDLLACLN